ncbi:MAG: DUF4389 domain-containing protein [Kineosporiaceae bacterium]|nr:DUF4389 domain-containing protein [Kineosporiaceae bacterium]MBK8075469.1 DUF4389 domain-containing protein [Kineosporiaceae bacterium]
MTPETPPPPTHSVYPVRIDAVLDEPLSRWLWLVKWLLAVPHYICLAFLWLAYVVLSVVAFFAILFTGRYPRAIFDFNVGVLRWSWRVSYYGHSAFGTDRYPPFSLREVSDYPAHLDVTYPEHLSRGLVLVKWWLLAIPHYLIVGLLVGGGTWTTAAEEHDRWRGSWGGGGLVTILALVAAVVLLVTGRYPRGLYDVLLGFDRWVLRVAAYAGLMTDDYPPFRLDMGGRDPGTAATAALPGQEPAVATTAPPAAHHRWTPRRTVSVIIGSMLVLLATGPGIAGLALGGADRFGRTDGYLTSPAQTFTVAAPALTTEGIVLDADGPDWALPGRILGTTRIRVTPLDTTRAVFVGIAPSGDAARYLSGSRYATVRSLSNGEVTYVEHSGVATLPDPAAQPFWVARATGTGQQTLTWPVQNGDWTVVVLNADGSSGVDIRADIAATAPALGWLALGLLVVAGLMLLVGIALIAAGVQAAAHDPEPVTSGGPPPLS